jgi:hypothetical protein
MQQLRQVTAQQQQLSQKWQQHQQQQQQHRARLGSMVEEPWGTSLGRSVGKGLPTIVLGFLSCFGIGFRV